VKTTTARKTYKFRILPSRQQEQKMLATLGTCRWLYNSALTERRVAYRMWKEVSQYRGIEKAPCINYNSQANQLKDLKEVCPELTGVHSQVLQDVLKRLDKAFLAFFSRVEQGQKPGYPRYKSIGRYNSFTYPQGGWSLHNNELTLSKIGKLKIVLHRQVTSKVKTVTISREPDGKWYVCFSVEYEYEFDRPLYRSGEAIGIDVGLEHYATLSNGEHIPNPRYYRKSEKHLAKVQRRYSKVKHLPRTDKKKQKARIALARAHKKVANQRKDFCHKLSRTLVNRFSFIAVEKLNVKGMAAGLHSKSVNDAAWSTFLTMLECKAEEAGTQVMRVSADETSQTCPQCARVKKKDLSERWHSCECGCEMQRDHAAAIVILGRGLATL
jgi:putative transposase